MSYLDVGLIKVFRALLADADVVAPQVAVRSIPPGPPDATATDHGGKKSSSDPQVDKHKTFPKELVTFQIGRAHV